MFAESLCIVKLFKICLDIVVLTGLEEAYPIHLKKLIQPLPYKDHAYEEIKKAIIAHDILEGSLLSERALSEQLGISRTPLREAIHRLEVEGWVTALPRKGVAVATIHAQDVHDVMQIRKVNEQLVLELITPVITIEQLAVLRQQFIPPEPLDDESIQPFVGGDKVHIQLAELCGNRRLLQLLQNLSAQMQWFGYWALKVNGRAQEVVHEHGQILDAIEERDIRSAQRLASVHLDHTETALLQGLKLRDHEATELV